MKPVAVTLDTAEEALRVLAEENAKRRKGRNVLVWSLGIGLAVLTILVLAVWIWKGRPPDLTSLSSLLVLGGAAASFTASHRAALKAASQFEDPRLVGFLLEARISSEEKDIIEATEAGLAKSLPLLDEPELLDPYQRHLLHRFLNHTQSKDLARLTLGAIKRVSGSEAIPTLEAFREAKSKAKDAEWQRIGEAALLVLPDVRLRVARKIIESRSEAVKAEADEQQLRIQ